MSSPRACQSFSRPLRTALLAISILGTIALSSCTLTPVHGGVGARTSTLQFRYAEPDNRLEQVFFQTLTQRLGSTQSPEAPLFDASVTASASRVGLSEISSPVIDYQVIATARYSVEINGEIEINEVRTASSGYQTTDQILADDTAREAAQEQAVRALAETVRLALLARLAPQS